MKKQKGKKPKYLIRAQKGLVKGIKWQRHLDGYPTQLLRKIRTELAKRLPGLAEKFNYNSRYFGYWVKDDKDRAYIYIQKVNLVIDLHIKPSYVSELKKKNFVVKPRNNFQGQNGWLTGWQVPHSTTDVDYIVNKLCMAFASKCVL